MDNGSKDNVNFESIDSIDLLENQISQDIIFLDDLLDSNINVDPPTSSTQNSSKMKISIADLPTSSTQNDSNMEKPSNSKQIFNIQTNEGKLTQINNEQCFKNAKSFHGPLRTSALFSQSPAPSSITLLSADAESSTSAVKGATCITMLENIVKNRTSKKSHVWDNFTKKDARTAQCQICMKILKHGGNTTNLMQHLTRMHPTTRQLSNKFIVTGSKEKEFHSDSDIMARKRKKVSESQDKSSENTNVKSVSVSSDQKIDHVFRQAHSFADGGTSFKNITNAILYMLATDYCPLSTVENEGFRNLMKTLAPRYKIPSRRSITRYMDDKYIFPSR